MVFSPELNSKLISGDVFPALKACCARRIHVIVASPFTGSAVTGNFSAVLADAVTFDVVGQAAAIFEKLTPSVVSFVMEDRLHVFVGAVIGFLPGASSGTLTLTIPPFILQPDLRRSFRVPLIDQVRMRVQVEEQGYRVLEPTIIDLSSGGMLVEFPDDPGLDLNSGHKIKIQLDGRTANFVAEVRHNHAGKYGLMFIDPMNASDALQDNESLAAIVSEIKDHWVSRTL
ncbi:MAG: PilZ domain-containing protein [Candidatus Hydrogenedentes bacterium]|nr:PilZ domain-containing protein [Candidatus Hydrogenedentota bacterium]